MLKAQADTRNDVQSVQRKMISEEHSIKQRLKAKKNEHVPNEVDNNKGIIERKEKKRRKIIGL